MKKYKSEHDTSASFLDNLGAYGQRKTFDITI